MGQNLAGFGQDVQDRLVESNKVVPITAEKHFVLKVAGDTREYWKNKFGRHGNIHNTIDAAENAVVGGRNDMIFISPDSHTQGSSLVLDKNITHYVGMCGPSMMNMRSRIGHNANFDKIIQLTAYGCTFQNLYLMHGRGSAANLTGLSIEDNRNSFYNCHIAGPMHTTEGDQATYKLINIQEASGGDGLEHYFNHCTIGIETTAMSDGELIKISGTPRLVFEDCNLLMRADANAPTFLDGTAGDGQGFILFKRTVGINLGTTLTVALGSTAWAAATDIIMVGNSGFTGATAVIAAANEAKVIFVAQPGTPDDDDHAGLAVPYDHTA